MFIIIKLLQLKIFEVNHEHGRFRDFFLTSEFRSTKLSNSEIKKISQTTLSRKSGRFLIFIVPMMLSLCLRYNQSLLGFVCMTFGVWCRYWLSYPRARRSRSL